MTYYWATFRCNFIWLETRPFSASQKVLQVLLADSAHKLWQLYSGLLRELYWCTIMNMASPSQKHNLIRKLRVALNNKEQRKLCHGVLLHHDNANSWLKDQDQPFFLWWNPSFGPTEFHLWETMLKSDKIWFKYLLCWSMQGDHSPDTLKPWQFFDDSQHSCPR